MRLRICLTLVSALTVAILAAAQENAPAKDAKADQRPFDEEADAKKALQTALQRAKKDNRRVLIEWGDSTNDWCVLLHKSFTAEAGLHKKRLYEYELITIAVGPMNMNQELAKQFQAALGDGIPYLTILDGDGKVLANERTDPFQTKSDSGQKALDAKKLLEFLTKHEAKPLVAAKVLQEGLDQAAKSNRLVFLHFGAPWCGWCHRLDDWMALPEISATLGKEFVDVRIDINRMDGGKEILERYNSSRKGGIPWFVFLDAKGMALVTSDGPKGNIGFPNQDHEVVHFAKMLDTTKRHLSPADIERIGQSLKAQKKAGKS
jgi:thiol-disulfide isomerase/thioredoxin